MCKKQILINICIWICIIIVCLIPIILIKTANCPKDNIFSSIPGCQQKLAGIIISCIEIIIVIIICSVINC